ncbi:GNAT family N-acetyltransferase [Knoellia subterranea]|uniref:Acetyltransferase n=1 Tax=Knoellia subterranea KCTC 19937 TaxID=1385521 RepID=A0A0A0JG96_9MICO|nr:GNAT family N-acetyltransferase [Knoellia subterranea]KGN36153.1 acetyltransferase [Knoellia subterranea KCTC 19937]
MAANDGDALTRKSRRDADIAGPSHDFLVTLVAAGELDDLIALRLAWKPAESDADAAALADDLRAWWERNGAGRRAWIARGADGIPLGMANAAIFERMPVPGRPAGRWVYVANVFVVPEHRRQGVAAALMTEIVAWARAEGMVRIVLAPSEMSIPFYASLGFWPADDLMRLDLD